MFFSHYIVMTTNKTRRSWKHKKKHFNKNNLDHDEKTKKKHRRHRRRNRTRRHSVSSWKNHYTYESNNDASISNISNSNKGTGNIINGLRDFLASKKK